MGATHPPYAQDEPVPEPHSRRVWDGSSWIEAMTIRRDLKGQFAPKNGNEPYAQLLLFGKDAA